MRTWNILKWDKPKKAMITQRIYLDCESCGMEAELPIANARVIATNGMGIFFDIGERQKWAMPKMIKCRNCGRTYVR